MLPKMQNIATDPLSAEVAAEMPTLPSVKTSLYRSCRASSATSVSIRHTTGRRLDQDNQRRTLFPQQRWRRESDHYISYGWPTGNLLANADTIYMDGTFECCPRLLYQVFTLNIFRGNQQFPVVYVLLPGKSHETYNRAFTLLKEAAQKMKYQTGL